MNSREVVRRIRAFHSGKPIPRGSTRHFHIAADKDLLIVSFVRMGGESRPWGVAYGHPHRKPKILTVPEGRNRDLVSEIMAEFVPTLLEHLSCPEVVGHVPESKEGIGALRQLWLPNPTHLDMLHHLAYAYTFTRFGKDNRKLLNAFGRACGWLFREAQRPGQQHVVVATDALRDSYTFPADDVRQSHLGFLMAWLEITGRREKRMAAAAAAERHSVATSLDPDVERQVEDLISAWGPAYRSDNQRECARLAAQIHPAIESQLRRRFDLTQQALVLLRADRRPVNPGVSELMHAALEEQWYQYLRIERDLASDEDGPAFVPSPETDRHPAAAAARYLVHEASADLVTSLLIHHDAELQAEAIAEGDAIRGTIVNVADEGNGRAVRPVWVLRSVSAGPSRLRPGQQVCVVGFPKRTAMVRSLESAADGSLAVEVEILNLKTAAKEVTGIHAIAPVSRDWKGKTITLTKAAAHQISRTKSFRVWQKDVPGAWLTYAKPSGPGALIDSETDVDDVASVDARM